jgi:hypothetical protein
MSSNKKKSRRAPKAESPAVASEPARAGAVSEKVASEPSVALQEAKDCTTPQGNKGNSAPEGAAITSHEQPASQPSILPETKHTASPQHEQNDGASKGAAQPDVEPAHEPCVKQSKASVAPRGKNSVSTGAAAPEIKPLGFWLKKEGLSKHEETIITSGSYLRGEYGRLFEPCDPDFEKPAFYDGPVWTDPTGLPSLSFGQRERNSQWRRGSAEMHILIGEQDFMAIKQDLVRETLWQCRVHGLFVCVPTDAYANTPLIHASMRMFVRVDVFL